MDNTPDATRKISVTLCRGCCCGQESKHPGSDHAGQARRLAESVAGRGRLWTVDCVGPCRRSNVVIVRTPQGGRTWFGPVLDPVHTEALAEWVTGGAPMPLPPTIGHLAFDPDVPDGRG